MMWWSTPAAVYVVFARYSTVELLHASSSCCLPTFNLGVQQLKGICAHRRKPARSIIARLASLSRVPMLLLQPRPCEPLFSQ